MNSTEESKFNVCTQCNKRIIGDPNQLCRRKFLFSSQNQTDQSSTIYNVQTDIINKNENDSIDNKSSGNTKLDEYIKETQLNSKCCDDFIEWIPYSNLNNLSFLTNGGNSKIYSGIWLLNTSSTSIQSTKIALKITKDFGNINNEIPIEVKMHHMCRSQYVIPFYGITKAPNEEDEYAMVIKYAEYGDLRNYIRKNFQSLNWTDKANILIKLSKALNSLHQMNFLHRDFHCKNILVDEDKRIFINDFELCQPIDSEIVSNSIHGVLPYIAPEVLRYMPYTKQSEVYSISMIMWELTSKKPPFSNYKHDIGLALAILIDELRPEIVEGTPDFYVDIMQKCWNPDPSQRPDASFLPMIFEEMAELCKIFDEDPSKLAFYQFDTLNDSKENSVESDYVTEAYKYSLKKLSLSTELQDNDILEVQEKRITEEFSIELTGQLNRLKLHKNNISQYITNSIDINSSVIIEDKLMKKVDDEKFKKTKYRKNSESEFEKRTQKLRRYQRASKLLKKRIRKSELLDDETADEIASQTSESEDSRYASRTYDFSLDDLNKSYNELECNF